MSHENDRIFEALQLAREAGKELEEYKRKNLTELNLFELKELNQEFQELLATTKSLKELSNVDWSSYSAIGREFETKNQKRPAIDRRELDSLERNADAEIKRLEGSRQSYFSFMFSNPQPKIDAYQLLKEQLKRPAKDLLSTLDYWKDSRIDDQPVAEILSQKRFCFGIFAPKSWSWLEDARISVMSNFKH